MTNYISICSEPNYMFFAFKIVSSYFCFPFINKINTLNWRTFNNKRLRFFAFYNKAVFNHICITIFIIIFLNKAIQIPTCKAISHNNISFINSFFYTYFTNISLKHLIFYAESYFYLNLISCT